MNESTRLRMSAATIMAILQWEPRILPTAASFEVGMDGKVSLSLDAQRTDGPRNGESILLGGVI
jgi:phage baseplate assembly protein W